MAVDILPTAEQQQLVDSVAGVLAARAEADRKKERLAVEAEILGEAASLGWLGIGLPEEQGGAGLGIKEEVLLFREFGRSLAPVALLTAAIGAHAAAAAGDGAAVSAMVAGDTPTGLALPLGAGAEHLLIESAPASLFVRPGEASFGILPRDRFSGIEATEALDPKTICSRATLAANIMAEAPAALRGRVQLLAAAELAGIAEAVRDMGTEYAKIREQFGQPIGAFQAVAHHCADMALRAEAALMQVLFAAIAAADERSDAEYQAQAALLVAYDAAFRNATINIRIHGGMGYSAESDAHLYLKRSILLREVAGGDRAARKNLLRQERLI